MSRRTVSLLHGRLKFKLLASIVILAKCIIILPPGRRFPRASWYSG